MTPAGENLPWNTPRQAIGYDWLHYQQHSARARRFAACRDAQQRISHQPECLKREIYRYGDYLEQQRGTARANTFYRYCAEKMLPRVEKVTQRWRLDGLYSPTSQAVFRGHFDTPFLRFLASRLVNMVARYNRMPDMNKTDVDLLGKDIAHFIRAELAGIESDEGHDLKTLHRWYLHAALICRQFNVEPPRWQRITTHVSDEQEMASAVMKMFNEKWWSRHLQRTAALWREHLFIALGSVSRKQHPYASQNCLRAWRDQKHRTREFLKGMELEDEEGNRISLIEQYDKSQANPAIRRGELMVRLHGFETICTELGYAGEFCTLTAPSSYHATLASGRANPRWSGANPQDTQRWLNRTWACIRARLHREGIRLFGIRVAEPHHDGTPHWHLLLFMPVSDRAKSLAILREYVLKEETPVSEQAQNARFQATSIDPQKGSATGYIAKFIAKNIDGYTLDEETDHETGRGLKEQSAAVCAWASRWRIRQFQFLGGAPVTVYRELRRLANSQAAQSISPMMSSAHHAADKGDWASYVTLQGGPFACRATLRIRPFYLSAGRFNDYGEEIVTLRGLYDAHKGKSLPLITRTKQWKIVPRIVPETDSTTTPSATPWSSVINCTDPCPLPAQWQPGFPLNRPQRRKLTRWLRQSPVRKPRTRAGGNATD